MKNDKTHSTTARDSDQFELTGEPSMTFLDVAEYYLKTENKPLSAREIVALALRDKKLISAGKTPWQTMKSKLSTDILSHGENRASSVFSKDPLRFATSKRKICGNAICQE